MVLFRYTSSLSLLSVSVFVALEVSLLSLSLLSDSLELCGLFSLAFTFVASTEAV